MPDFVGLDLIKTFGVAGDIPIISEVTGDYMDDIGIFRPSVARWWFKGSPNYLLDCMSHSFGVAGDVPIYGKPAGVP